MTNDQHNFAIAVDEDDGRLIPIFESPDVVGSATQSSTTAPAIGRGDATSSAAHIHPTTMTGALAVVEAGAVRERRRGRTVVEETAARGRGDGG